MDLVRHFLVQLQRPRLWSVLNVAIPERTIALGVRAVEGRFDSELFPIYAAVLGICSITSV